MGCFTPWGSPKTHIGGVESRSDVDGGDPSDVTLMPAGDNGRPKEVATMFARVSKLQGPPEMIDQAVQYANENILPRAKQMKGWKGALSLGDRSSGEGLLVTFWETEEDMRASEGQGAQLRQQSADQSGGSVGETARYEVLVDEMPR